MNDIGQNGFAFQAGMFLQLRIYQQNKVTTIPLVFSYRVLDNKTGEVRFGSDSFTISAASAGTPLTKVYWFTDQTLLSCQLAPQNGASQLGSLYGVAEARQGTENNSISIYQFFGGYAAVQQNLTWPISGDLFGTDPTRRSVVEIAIPAPAAGTGVTYALPAYERFTIQGIRAQLVTDANVANRQLLINIQDLSGTYLLRMSANPASLQTAGTTRNYYFVAGYPIRDTVSASILVEPFPPALDLVGTNQSNATGFQIYFQILNVQAGDQLSNVYLLTSYQITTQV